MLVHPSYFPAIIQFVAQVNSRDLVFEIEDNFQKQTYRNRCYIYGSNGRQMLNVPILHQKKGSRTKTKDIQIDYSESWQKMHIKTLDSAYSSSPFYEFYREDLVPAIERKYKYLLDLNFETIISLNQCLEVEKYALNKTSEYKLNIEENTDYRGLIQAKSNINYNLQKYTQVFDNKYGFISNLSCLDLIFNEGPNALEYLENHKQLIIEI